MPKRSTRDIVAERRKRRGWTPFKGPQLAAYLADDHVDQIGYGGAGGGGKTDLSLGLAMLKHRKTIFYRREYPQLQGAVDRSQEIYHKFGKWNEQKHRWALRKGGVSRGVRFGAMQREKDMEKWRGTPCDLRVFDEAQNFLEKQVRFTMGWTRTNVPKQKCTDLLCFNPPTSPEGLWLIDFFAPWLDVKHPNPAKEGEVRYFAQVEGKEYEMPSGEPFAITEGVPILLADGKEVVPKASEPGTTKPKSRTFFKALVQDNPVYMSTGYMAQLQALPEPLRSQMLKGDFTAGLEDHAWQVIPTEWVKLAQARWEAARGMAPEGIALSALGVDVARGGKDKTVLQPRYGVFFPYPEVHPGTSTPDGPAVAQLVASLLMDLKAPKLAPNVDVIGVGSSVYDTLRGPGYNIEANGVNFASASYGRDESGLLEYANVRAEAYWEFRQALDPKNGLNICLPPDRELLADLTAPRWSMSPNGILIEAKEGKGKIVERLGRSPDKGDAVVLSWYQAPLAGYGNLPGRIYR